MSFPGKLPSDSLPLNAKSNLTSPRLVRRATFVGGDESTLAMVGAVVGFIVLLVLVCACCGCCKGKAINDPAHTHACNAANTERKKPRLGQQVPQSVCTCAPRKGMNSWQRREPIPPIPHEIHMDTSPRMNRSTGIWETGRDQVTPLEVAPPPYSPPANGIEGLKGPEPVVVRPPREQAGHGQNANATVWREGDGNGVAPEIRGTGYWGRWAA